LLSFSTVYTDQADSYGAVKVWKNGAYFLVCADSFDDREASVVCRTMGYPYGKSLCCDAFGFQTAKIGFSSSGCTGREMSYDQCKKSFGGIGCNSKQYASVVCSRERAIGKSSFYFNFIRILYKLVDTDEGQ
jgi:hypothetical protein